jgi:hypothetical protein
MGLLLALIGSFVESMYYIRSPLRIGGDESWAAAYLGLPRYAIELPLALAFIVCFILGLRALGNWRIGLKWMTANLLGSELTGLLLTPEVTLDDARRLFGMGTERFLISRLDTT